MKYKNPLIVVEDLERSIQFYTTVLGLHVTLHLGSNVNLTGGISLQTRESWQGFLHKSASEICFHGNDAELYFEEDNFDAFLQKLQGIAGIEYVHPVQEHSWGQRAVRIYDPDYHIIEIGENIKFVCRRFLESGMTEEEAAVRMDVPLRFVRMCKK